MTHAPKPDGLCGQTPRLRVFADEYRLEDLPPLGTLPTADLTPKTPRTDMPKLRDASPSS